MSEPKPAEPLTLSVNCIHNGQFYQAGSVVPFKDESEPPESLKAFVATAEAPAPEPVQRNIYELPLSIRRQMRGLERTALEKAWVEEQADEPLREDVAAALQDAHDIAVGRARAQAKFDAAALDAAYEAAQPPEPPQLFVRRGGAWGRVQNAKLKVGEHVFVKRENGEMESVGVVDSRGEPPPRRSQYEIQIAKKSHQRLADNLSHYR